MQGPLMDALDQQLISLLHTNARASIAELAHKLKVSRGTVSNRITKLETQGVIVGYTVQLKPHNQPSHITAWMSILVEGNDSRRVVASLLGEPSVNALHGTNGRWDLLAELKEHLENPAIRSWLKFLTPLWVFVSRNKARFLEFPSF